MENPRFVDEEGKGKKKAFGKKKDGKADKKDKGYVMFEEENSEEESLVSTEDKDGKTPMKLKKHSKPSFKFVKKEKSYKPKEKEKEEKKKDEKKKDEKLKFKKKRHPPDGQATTVNEKPIFGVPLPVAVARNKSYDGVQLPAIFRECIDYVEEFGLQCEGIYRISGVKSKVQALKDAYNKGLPVYLQEYEPNVVAGLLKQFLRELPEPVLTLHLMPKFEQASTMKNVKQRVGEFQRLIEELPTCNRLLLSWVIVHMTHVIAKEKQNKMSLQNVSIVLSPTMQISHRVLNVLFTANKILFKDTVIKKYVPPLKPVTSRWSLDLPESPTSLEEELRKQEILLDELHKEVMRVKDTAKEEQLWEVQRVVTGLKRKLKLIKKGPSYSPSASRITINERAIDVKPEPPKKLHLKIGEDDLDLRRPESFSQMRSQQQKSVTSSQSARSPQAKPDNLQAPKAVSKKVGGLRPVGTPTKDSGMDIGTIEMDSSAQSHSQRARPDSSKIEQVEQKKTDNKTEAVKAEEDTMDEKAAKTETQAKSSPEKTTESESQDISNESESAKIETSQANESTEVLDSEKSEEMNSETDETNKQNEMDEIKEKDITHKSEIIKKDSEVNEERKHLKSEVKVFKDDAGNAIVKPKTSMPKVLPKPETMKELTVPNSSPANYIDDIPVSKTPEVHAEPSAPPAAEVLEPESLGSQPPLSVKDQGQITKDQEAPVPVRTQSLDGGVAPEQLAAALSNLVIRSEAKDEPETEMQEPEIEETEEELNERIMSQFVADFGIERPEECDEEYEQLLEEYQTLLLEEEELIIIGAELRKKIESEQYESERLDEELTEIRAMREDLYSSDENSDSSDDSDEDEEDLAAILDQLTRDNDILQAQNKDLTEKIHQEVQDCLRTKVQIRLLQHKQLESSKNNELDLLL